ncbi:MAG: hypothetical protein NT015_16825 [Alphaproteobacteria bacterium]|nr:hypothetical protein [Alphaproteobacteria bacterium]
MKLAWLALAAGLVAMPAFAQQGGGRLAMLQAADTNHDGSITRAEAQAARSAMFELIDSNDDGFVSEAERAAVSARSGGSGRNGFEGADANRDGRISRTEMANLPYRGFERLDRNHDDIVSTEELDLARRFLQRR